jgi:hypothetical protein
MEPWSFKQKMKRTPEYAASRAEVCAVYRKLRADNPTLARMVYQRVCAVQRALDARIFDQLKSN